MSASHIRVLIAPCGCMGGADATDEFPGFCRTPEEAAEDTANGWTEYVVSPRVYRLMQMGCTHEPEWKEPA